MKDEVYFGIFKRNRNIKRNIFIRNKKEKIQIKK
jgi:hypothetical protein